MAKTNFGLKGGKFMFEIQYVSDVNTEPFSGPDSSSKNQCTLFFLEQKVVSNLFESNKKHLLRIGFAASTSKVSLGTDFESCGYENSAVKYGKNNEFSIRFFSDF